MQLSGNPEKYQVKFIYFISAGPGVDLFTWEGIYRYPNNPYIYITHTHTYLSIDPSLPPSIPLYLSLSLSLPPSRVRASTDPNLSIYIGIGTLVHIFSEMIYSADSKDFWSHVDSILSLGIAQIQLNAEPTP